MQTAYNPETGEYLGLVGGKWEKLQTASDGKGNVVFLDASSGSWQPLRKSEAQMPRELTWGEVGQKAISNFMPSMARASEEIGHAIMNPVDTVKAIGNLGLGLAQKLVPGTQGNEKYADAVGQYFGDRYFSGENNLKQTLANDPFGALADVASVATGGGSLLKGGAKVAGLASPRVGNALSKVGGAVGKVGEYADPLSFGAHAAAGVTNLGYGRGMDAAQKLYQSALKPSTTKYGQDAINQMTQAAIENRIPMTNAGYHKANDIVSGLSNKLDDLITEADAKGVKIDPEDIARNALWSDARKKLSKQVNPERDLRTFDNAVDEYYANHLHDTSVGATQESKKATYEQLNKRKSYNNNTPIQNGSLEAQKELARQQKIAIEQAVPEAHDLNARAGTLLNLMDTIAPAATRTANHNIFGLGPSMLASNAGTPAAATTWAAILSALKSPGVKSQLAFALDNMNKRGTNPWLRGLTHGLYGAGSTDTVQDWYLKNQ